MDPLAIGVISVGLLLVLVFFGIHVGLALWIVGFGGTFLIRGSMSAFSVVEYLPLYSTLSYGWAIIPLFMLMGELVETSGTVTTLFNTAYKWLGRLPGGLAIVTLFTNTGLAATTGSSLASTAMVIRTALPEMEKYGYERTTSIGIIAVSGTLAVLIPPSIFLVFYAILTEVSIGKILLAGFLPGFWNALMYLLTIVMMARLNPKAMPRGPSSTWKEKLASLPGVWGVAVIIGVIIGGLYTGVVTPTEVGGLGVLIAIVLVFVTRRFRWRTTRDAAWNATWSTAMIFFVMVGAFAFSDLLVLSGLNTAITEYIIELNAPHFVKFAGMILILLILGCFVDAISMLAITIPIFLPIVLGLGWDPIWFGIICTVMVEVAALTPPLGMVVYTAVGIAREENIMGVFRACLPFIGVQAITVTTLYLVPQIALWLPSIAMK